MNDERQRLIDNLSVAENLKFTPNRKEIVLDISHKIIRVTLIAGIMALPVFGLAQSNIDIAMAEQRNSDTCEIKTDKDNGLVRIQSIFYAEKEGVGSYKFAVSGNGVNISQGGDFDAISEEPTLLGQLILSANKKYKADLQISYGGTISDCQLKF